jgi:hypothetical protein
MHFITTLDFSSKIRVTVSAVIDFQADTTTLTHIEVEGDPAHENLLQCFSEPILMRMAALTLQAFEATTLEAE